LRQLTIIGELVKTTRVYLFLFAVLLSLPIAGVAQSNAKPDYKHQHKAARNYQKQLMKQQHKQQRADAKRAKAYRKQHQ
jgi:hypothetical protein